VVALNEMKRLPHKKPEKFGRREGRNCSVWEVRKWIGKVVEVADFR